MRLSEEKARQLNALVWRDRMRRWVPMIAVIIAVTSVLTFFLVRQVERADQTVDVKEHAATVLSVKRTGARGAAIVNVHLDDGRDVEALSTMRVDPMAGTHVVVDEARHASGRLTYDITRVVQ
jgi:hypothetical protein